IGANWGWYAVLIAARPSFRGKVHAFEPFPSTFADLAAVVRQAGLEGCISCHDFALADRDGEAGMAFSDGIQSGLARLGEIGGTTVRLARLDSLDLPPPDVIKIDAEDHEMEALVGASQVINTARPTIVFENWLHRDRPGLTLDPIAFLAERSYHFFLPGWVRGNPDCILPEPGDSAELALVPFRPEQRFLLPSQINIVAVPEEKLAAFAARFR
ncbi:MAG: FkbM family methyltransferase, partial [Magnetospirillum sp.]